MQIIFEQYLGINKQEVTRIQLETSPLRNERDKNKVNTPPDLGKERHIDLLILSPILPSNHMYYHHKIKNKEPDRWERRHDARRGGALSNKARLSDTLNPNVMT